MQKISITYACTFASSIRYLQKKMTRRFTTKNFKLALLNLAVLAMSFVSTGCERKELWLRTNGIEFSIAIYDIRLELLWGVDWESQWQYDWDEDLFGYVGYSEPDWIRAIIYNHDITNDTRTPHISRNFARKGGRVNLNGGSWYDMLFYNSDTEYILFNQDANLTNYVATTRSANFQAYTRGAIKAQEFIEDIPTYTEYNQPDELFGAFLENMLVSEDPEDYEIEYDANGQKTYVYNVNAELRPYSFIYLVQVMVINNTDSLGYRVKAGKGMTMTGLAGGVELYSRKTWNNVVSITTEDVKPIQRDKSLKTPDGERIQGDIFAARLLTWGLPSIEPLREATRGETEVNSPNYLGVGIITRSGASLNMTYDITEQMHEHPAGGVITVVIDAAQIDDKYMDKPVSPTGGGGFNASVEQWANEYEASVTI